MTRFVVFSDTHCFHNKIPKGIPAGDVLLFCGDMSTYGFEKDIINFVFFYFYFSFYFTFLALFLGRIFR
jgi:hypothetical protein